MEDQLGCEQAPGCPTAPGILEEPTSTKLRVLVADDNADLAGLLAELLEMAGHKTRVVHSGPEALEAARSFLPDVLLLDISLPGMNGYEVAKAIRRESLFKYTLLVALTGWDADSDKQAAAEAGFDVHLAKPLDFNALSEVLKGVRRGNGDVDASATTEAVAHVPVFSSKRSRV